VLQEQQCKGGTRRTKRVRVCGGASVLCKIRHVVSMCVCVVGSSKALWWAEPKGKAVWGRVVWFFFSLVVQKGGHV